ncbi:Histidinol-phosphate aminotransferase [Tenacibaculum litopenaei]|uniref:histidinol-phosphate transaminase n=1 Tax=Tenacibaculum litopenaei TaxID=396016 RepID=UPI0038933E27
MFNLEAITRKNIWNLKAYSSARDEFQGKAEVYLDANENPFGNLNRYPDPYQRSVKERLSVLKGLPVNQVFIGNGSDEVIDLCLRIFCEPGKEKALTFVPTYGMYQVSAAINDIELLELPLTDDFDIDLELVQPYLTDASLKVIFLCSPNNPTGNCLSVERIASIAKAFRGVVLVDEAYIDFSTQTSWTEQLAAYPNLIISQTFSKAWGMAAARVGVAYASSEIIGLFNKVKPPYNISSLNQQAVLTSLDALELYERNKAKVLNEREVLLRELPTIGLVKKIYPTETNFILVEMLDADTVYEQLVARGIIIRNRSSLIANCLRISVGTQQENKQLINALKALSERLVTE